MIISLIYAMDEDRGIGKNGKLPWHLQVDLKRFKKTTMAHHIIMGRKTFDSIGKLLSGRTMIIITRKKDYFLEGCLVAHSLEDALEQAKNNGEGEVFVIGGSEIFALALPLATRLYQTLVHAHLDCDVTFPEFDLDDWTEISSSFHPADEKNQYPTTYRVLVRK